MADQFEKDIARLEEIMAEMAAAAAEKDLEQLDSLMVELKGLFPTEEMAEGEEGESSPSTFVVSTPFGQFKVDMEEFEAAKTRAREKVNPPQVFQSTPDD